MCRVLQTTTSQSLTDARGATQPVDGYHSLANGAVTAPSLAKTVTSPLPNRCITNDAVQAKTVMRHAFVTESAMMVRCCQIHLVMTQIPRSLRSNKLQAEKGLVNDGAPFQCPSPTACTHTSIASLWLPALLCRPRYPKLTAVGHCSSQKVGSLPMHMVYIHIISCASDNMEG